VKHSGVSYWADEEPDDISILYIDILHMADMCQPKMQDKPKLLYLLYVSANLPPTAIGLI